MKLNIQINAKLTAYTKYVQPDLTDYVIDAPDDSHLYARKNRAWVNIDAPNDGKIYAIRSGEWKSISAPHDGQVYALKNDEWVNITDSVVRDTIVPSENSGLNIYYDEEANIYTIGIRKEEILETELPPTLAEDTTYYVESCAAEEYINGGTAWSNGGNDYVYISEYDDTIYGGGVEIFSEEVEMINGVNSKGVYDESKN